MTKIVYSENNSSFSLTLKDHSGDPSVCTAVSTLAQTLYYAVYPEIYEEDKDRTIIYIEGKGEDKVKAARVIMCGLEALSRQFPHNVVVHYKLKP